MTRPRRIDDGEGWINRRFEAIERRLLESKAEKRLPRSTFPAGVIPSTALADPNAPGFVNLSVTGIGVALAGGNVISSSVTVPPGFTSGVVALMGRVFAYNSTAVDDWLYSRVQINGFTGNAYPVHADAFGGMSDSALNVGSLSVVLEGLTPGGSFTVALWAATAVGSWAADPSNGADLVGSVGWF